MKRIAIMFCSVLIALLGATGVANANAREAGAAGVQAVVNCQHGSTYGTIVSAAYVKRYDGKANLGAIQLCRDNSSNYWAFLIFYDPVPNGNWGNAYLNRYDNGVYKGFLGCNSPGGNDYVKRGETRCWTPKVHAPGSQYTFLASGIQCEGTFPACTFRQAVGLTARMR